MECPFGLRRRGGDISVAGIPKLRGYSALSWKTVAEPGAVYEGNAGTLLAVRREDGLYLVVVYREVAASDGFIITAYLTRRIRGGRLAWKR